jgi:hypothetical protein
LVCILIAYKILMNIPPKEGQVCRACPEVVPSM